MKEKIRNRLAAAIVFVMIGSFFFGLLRFFGGPLFSCLSGDCGRPAEPHDAAYAHQFLGWQTSVFVIWAIGLFVLWLLRSSREKM